MDMEAILTNNQAKVTGSATTAPTLAGLGAWVATNTSKGSGGADPSPTDGTATRTDGTQRAFTEVLLKNVLKSVYDNSGEEPNMVMLGTFNKQVFSTFGGNAQRMNPAESGKLMAAVDKLAA